MSVLLVLAMRREALATYRSPRPRLYLLRAAFGSIGGTAAIHAAANIPIADATSIGQSKGVIVVVLGVVLLGETVSRRHWCAITLCAGGAAIAVAGQGAFRAMDPGYLAPATVALVSAVLIAGENIYIKTLSTVERSLTVLLYVNAFGALLLAAPAFGTWQSTVLWSNVPFLFLGPLAITAQYCIIRGFRIADVSVVAPVGYLWIVFAAMIGIAFFGEVPAVSAVLGSLIIILGGIKLARLPG